MNLRALCFYRLAAAAGNGALWWDYALRFADQCTTANNTFNTECATRVRGGGREGSCKGSREAQIHSGTRAVYGRCPGGMTRNFPQAREPVRYTCKDIPCAAECDARNCVLCAAAVLQVFDSLNAASLATNNTGREVWDHCSFINETAGSGEKIQLLEVSGSRGQENPKVGHGGNTVLVTRGNTAAGSGG